VKIKIPVLLLVGILGLTACGVDNSDYENDNGNPNDNSYIPRGVVNSTNDKDKLDDFGYSRIQEPVTNKQIIKDNAPLIDRRKLAELISQNAVLAPEVEDVTTLVTDEEVFVAYTTNSQNRNAIADQVKKTALTFVPRFFDVYVSDDPHMRPLIDRYQGLDASTEHIEDSIDDVIKEFKKSPQGENMNTRENNNAGQNDDNQGLNNNEDMENQG
jgi:hypothetical protein